MGYCSGYDVPGRRFYGRGGQWSGYGTAPARAGRGRGGGGRGWRHWYHATGLPRWARGPGLAGWDVPPAWAHGPAYDAPGEYPSREQEIEMLKDEAAWLKGQLNAINERMDELSQE